MQYSKFKGMLINELFFALLLVVTIGSILFGFLYLPYALFWIFLPGICISVIFTFVLLSRKASDRKKIIYFLLFQIMIGVAALFVAIVSFRIYGEEIMFLI